MKKKFLIAICVLLIISVAMGGLSYDKTVGYFSDIVGNIISVVEKAKKIVFDVKSVPDKDILELKGSNPESEEETLKEVIIHQAAVNGGCEIPDIEAMYPYTYIATIDGEYVEGVRFKYAGEDFIFWCPRGTHWKGYLTYNGIIPHGRSYVIKMSVKDIHVSSEYDLNDLRLNPLNWRVNLTITETKTEVYEFVRDNFFD